jgi:hypothetical protein
MFFASPYIVTSIWLRTIIQGWGAGAIMLLVLSSVMVLGEEPKACVYSQGSHSSCIGKSE